MKPFSIYLLLTALAFAAPSLAANDSLGLPEGPNWLLRPTPERVIRLHKKTRMPASVDQKRAEQQELVNVIDKKLTIGGYAVILNSVSEWNNKVVQIIARYDDGGRQIQLENGSRAQVRAENLHTLSPETDKCCTSHGVQICKDDKVYHPLPSSSIYIPEGKIVRVFESCSVQVRDGLDFIYDVEQIGKAVDCSPQKESVCVGKIGNVDGYRNGNRYTVEGPVTQVYTNGTVLIRTGLWQLPVDATAVRVITESIYGLDTKDKMTPETAVLTNRDGQGKLPVPTQVEIEPFDANDSQRAIDVRGITVPAVPGTPRVH